MTSTYQIALAKGSVPSVASLSTDGSFVIGGRPIEAVRLANRVKSILRLELAVRAVFVAQTMADPGDLFRGILSASDVMVWEVRFG